MTSRDGGWVDRGKRKTSYTRGPGLWNTLTCARCALLFSYSLLLVSSSVSVPRLVGRVLKNINRMHSCLITNPHSSAPWPPALDHVRSPPALTAPDSLPNPTTPSNSEEFLYVHLCDVCTCATGTVLCPVSGYAAFGLGTCL